MTTGPFHSQGTYLYISNENAATTVFGSATFAQIGQVHTLGAPSGEAADIDVTHLLSTAKEYLIGLPDNGNMTIGMNALASDAGHTVLIAATNDQNSRWLKIVWAGSAGTWSIAAFVKKYTWTPGVDQKIDAESSFRTTGAWTRA